MPQLPPTKTDIRALFRRVFAYTPPQVIRVPASLELLGGYTESHGGLICSTAVDRYVDFAISQRNDGRIAFVAGAPDRHCEIWLREFTPGKVPGWAAQVAAIVQYLQELGTNIRGFNAAVVSGIPPDMGLGETSSLSLATVLGLQAAFKFDVRESGLRPQSGRSASEGPRGMTRRECHRLADICCAGEVTGRLGDGEWFRKVSPLLNLPFELSQHDALHRTSESHPLMGDYALVLLDSGVRDVDYGTRRSHTELRFDVGAARLGVKRLRSATPELLKNCPRNMTGQEKGATWFWTGECARAVAVEKALAAGDLAQFGCYLSQSHDDARRMAGLTVPELDLLAELAMSRPECAGARFSGSPTHGGVVCLVHRSSVDRFLTNVTMKYERSTGRICQGYQVNPVPGVVSNQLRNRPVHAPTGGRRNCS